MRGNNEQIRVTKQRSISAQTTLPTSVLPTSESPGIRGDLLLSSKVAFEEKCKVWSGVSTECYVGFVINVLSNER